jgi:Sec-independent protein translocase protein TatA
MDSGFSGNMIFLAFLVLLQFGPRKLPEIVKVVGRVAVEFKRAANEFRGQFSREIGELAPSQAPKNLGSLAPVYQKTLKVRRDLTSC